LVPALIWQFLLLKAGPPFERSDGCCKFCTFRFGLSAFGLASHGLCLPRSLRHRALQIAEPGLAERKDVLSGGLSTKVNVRVRLQKHHPVCILDQKNQDIRVLAPEMQVHDAPVLKQAIPVFVDASAIAGFRHAFAPLDTLDDVVQFLAQHPRSADAGKVLELCDVNRFRLAFYAAQPQPQRRISRPRSPKSRLCRSARLI
ncbi:MAG: hypothetical protein ACHQ7M_19075, partial [Chloroflexota bacterium]